MDMSIIANIITGSVKQNGSKFTSYLELGIDDKNQKSPCILLSNRIKRIVGVDINPKSLPSSIEFNLCTTDEFFSSTTETFDAIFIDADHRGQSVSKDLENSLKVLNKGGLIFIHDLDPSEKIYEAPEWCGDGYKILDSIDSNMYNYIVLPFDTPGIAILQRKEDLRYKEWRIV